MNKTKIVAILTYISAISLILTLMGMLFAVFGDIAAGALHGEAETGWGFLAAILSIPAAIASLVAFLAFSKIYKNTALKPVNRRHILVVCLPIAVIIVALSFIYTRVSDSISSRPYKLNAADVQLRRTLDSVVDSARTNYPETGTVQSKAEMAQLLPQGITYDVVNSSTVKLCANFESDTVSHYYDPKHPNVNGGTAGNVVNDKTIGITDSDTAFYIHKSGLQCYKIAMINP